MIVLSDVGGAENVSALDITIDDEAATKAPSESRLQSRNYQPTNDEGETNDEDEFGSGVPDPDGQTLERFDDINPNGTWQLYVRDDNNDFAGAIEGGWSLRIETTNSAPKAEDDSYRFRRDETVRVSSANGLLANDSDPDAEDDKIEVQSTGKQKTEQGSVTIRSNGSFIYDPDENASGRDRFKYTITDEDGRTDTAKVVISFRRDRDRD